MLGNPDAATRAVVRTVWATVVLAAISADKVHSADPILGLGARLRAIGASPVRAKAAWTVQADPVGEAAAVQVDPEEADLAAADSADSRRTQP